MDQNFARQWRDVLGVLKVQAGPLDRAYLVHWAGELPLTELLQHALSEAGPADRDAKPRGAE